jgi:hypothetical protein
MAKGQKRGNREIRKPKVKKSPVAVATSSLSARGLLPPSSTSKKKDREA